MKATILQGSAIGLAVLSGFLATEAFGGFAAFAPLLVGVAWLVAVVSHNRQVKHEHRQPHATAP